MKILSIPQMMFPENQIRAMAVEVEPAGTFYLDTNERAKGKIDRTRPTEWRAAKFEATHTFEEACEMFPQCVQEVRDDHHPRWGSCYYTKESWPIYHKQNWDTSD